MTARWEALVFTKKLLDLVVKNAPVQDGDQVLDIGCGTGLLGLKILAKKDCVVTGIDYSREMTEIFKDKIRNLHLEDRVSIRIMDAGDLRFKKHSFDLAVSTVTLHHLKNKLPAIKKIHDLLKPGGTFILGDIDMDTTGSLTDPNRLKRILTVLEQEWVPALKEAGVKAFVKMFDNGKKHILNDGEYCVSLEQWSKICRNTGFRGVKIKRVPGHKCFGIVIARKG